MGYSMPWWQSAETSIRASISIRNNQEYDLHLGVHIGLDYVNITLFQESNPGRARASKVFPPRLLPRNSLLNYPSDHSVDYPADIHFNEHLRLDTAQGMRQQMREALKRGLPVPILTVLDYFVHQKDGFRWSVDYRLAGYCCQFVLTLTLISWALMNIFFMVIPEYGALAMATTGWLALFSVFLYWILLPSRHLIINISGQLLTFQHGECFWIVMTTGLVATLTGTFLWLLEVQFPGTLIFDLLLETDLPASKTTFRDVSTHSMSSASTLPAQASFRHSFQPFKSCSFFSEDTGRRTRKSESGAKQDSGISSNLSDLADQTSFFHLDDLDRIATSNGSYLQSTVSSVSSLTFFFLFYCHQC